MKSIFEMQDNLVQPLDRFWNTSNSFIDSFSFRSQLTTISKSQVPKVSTFVIQQNLLIKQAQDSYKSDKQIILDWKLVQPFIEENPSDTRFGFTIGYDYNSKDFYVENIKEFEEWMNKLKNLAIMTDLDQDYDLVREIGRGNFAKVYLAVNQISSQQFAVKSISKERIVGSLDNHKALIHEISIMRKINHPNVVKIHQIYESQTHIHLILDYVKGGSLYSRVVAKKRFSEDVVKEFSVRLLAVIRFLHANGIVHRDLKLENILMISNENHWEFKLTDFGLAEEAISGLYLRCGSPGYIAPEILKKQIYDSKVDVFSCGVIFYVLLFGRMPFLGKSSSEVLNQNRECLINFNPGQRLSISRDAIQFLQRLTDPIPESRISADESLHLDWISSNPFKI